MSKPSSASARNGRALFLAAEPPYPTIGGGPLRSASVFEYLTSRYRRVDAIVFEGSLPAGKADRVLTINLPRHSKSTLARSLRNARRYIRNRPPLLDRFSGFEDHIRAFVEGNAYDLTIVEHFWCAPYAAQVRPVTQRLVLDLHNIESAWHESMAQVGGGLLAAVHRRFAAAYRAHEREWLPHYDWVLVPSQPDANRLCLNTRVLVYPNALPCIPDVERREENQVIFTGNLEYEPNRTGVRWFREKIWPRLRTDFPDLTWHIVGKNPHAVAHLVSGDNRIRLIGPVPDAIAALARAKVAVVPLLSGSGTRLKILEAWATGTAVVSTTLGAEGLEAVSEEHLLIADNPEPFAARVAELLRSPDKRQHLGEAGRLYCRERYTWEIAWSTLETIVR